METVRRWACGAVIAALGMSASPLRAGDHPEHPKKSEHPEHPTKQAKEPALALAGDCPVCLVEMGKKVEGKKGISSVYRGFEYRFPSEKEKKMFDADPAKYALQNDGGCPVCKVDMKKDMKGDPAVYAVHDGKVYAFLNAEMRKKFEADTAKYAGKKTEHPEHPKKSEHPEHPKKPEHPEHPK